MQREALQFSPANTTMRPMPRTLASSDSKNNSKHKVVQSQSRLKDKDDIGGMTFSIEEDGDGAAARAEYDVLCAILSRESYLQRLEQVVKTINKKFKPEIADILDLIRSSSLDVIELIKKWRVLKKDNAADFMWNGLNYVLKMPSDLDYLADYLAIQKWVGFPLIRNPFCIPFPMQAGETADDVISLQNIDRTGPAGNAKSKKLATTTAVYSDDIKRIRDAERVILDAETNFGVMSRNPDGRLVPVLQALTKKAAVELKKDERRPLNEPAKSSNLYAPHAMKCDVGLAPPEWTPNNASDEQKAESHFIKLIDNENNARNKGRGKIGGALSELSSQGANSFQRKPIKPSIATEMDFRRQRKMKSLQERIQTINSLKSEIQAIEQQQESNDNTMIGFGEREGEDEKKKQSVMRSILSSQSVMKFEALLPSIGSPSSPSSSLFAATPVTTSASPITRSFSQSSLGMNKKLSSSSLPTGNNRSASKLMMRKGVSTSKSSIQLLEDDNEEEEGNEEHKQHLSIYTPEVMKKTLDKEIATAVRRLNYHNKDEKILTQLKLNESMARLKQRAREIERKRRLLTLLEGRQVLGPPPEEEINVYDYYITQIQSVIRGWLARCYVKWYREVSTNACLLIQSVIRGWFGRMKVFRIRRKYRAAVTIQKNFRGWLTRGTSAMVAKQRQLFKKAIEIQRVWRGILGRRRAESKRKLDLAAKDAFDAVDTKTLVSSDVKELARRIIYAIEEPTTTSFPPDEVLHLIQLTILVIGSARGNLGLTDYDFFNLRHYAEYSGKELTWQLAAKMVNRSERFIRLIRAVAYGPGAKPPRLIQLTNEANLLYAAQAGNPRWSIRTFESMGMGSRICVQLFKWLTSVVEIASRQQEFLSLIATSFPDWLPKLNELQIMLRYCECELEILQKCLSILHNKLNNLTGNKNDMNDNEGEEGVEEVEDQKDGDYIILLTNESKIMKRNVNEMRNRYKDTLTEIEKLKNDQSAREIVALESMKQRVETGEETLRELARKYADTLQLSQSGDRTATELLSEVRHELTNHRLKLSELDAQKKLLEIQIETNRAKRKDPTLLPPEILYRATMIGEAKAAQLIASVDCKAMLKSAGVKDPMDLPFHLIGLYDDLATVEDTLRITTRKGIHELEAARKVLDDIVSRSIIENDIKEQKSKDQMIPTDEELMEERIEDESEAITERIKHMQYIPDEVLFTIPQRPRPVIIAFSRDLSYYMREKLFEQITKLMPGLFISIDYEKNFGFDLIKMQSILDAKKCILMEVDHGLTRSTRYSFLTTLEMSLHALIPSPVFIVLVGDQHNIKADRETVHCGVSMKNINILCDGKLKSAMEQYELYATNMINPKFITMAQQYAMALSPPSNTLGIVLEAMFVLLNSLPDQSNNNINPYMHSLTWQLTRQLLIDPMNYLYKRIYTILKHGQASHNMIVCIEQYINHPDWPSSSALDDDRIQDMVIHTLASFIELYLEIELLCLQSGGIPLQSLTKSSIQGIQAVITVSDNREQLPSYLATNKIALTIRNKANITYEQASYLAVRAALQDLRVYKQVIKLENNTNNTNNNTNSTKKASQLYTVSVYRELNQIYIEVYTSQTSEIYLTCISAENIPSLLVPNGLQLETNNKQHILPPNTCNEMYEKIIKLIHFESMKTIELMSLGLPLPQQITCKRDYTFIKHCSLYIDGYYIQLKAYEAAMGELYFIVYISELSITLKLLVSTVDRAILLQHADQSDETKELIVAQSMNGRALLPYLLDRLHIYPQKSFLHSVYHNNLALVKHVAVWQHHHHLVELQQKTKTNESGFILKVKVYGKVGKLVLRRIIKYFDILFVIEVRICQATGVMDITAYEPITSKTCSVRISKFISNILFGTTINNKYTLFTLLQKVIKINWHNSYTLECNYIVYKKVIPIWKRAILFQIQILSETTILLILFDLKFSTKYTTEMTLDAICELLNLPFEYALYQQSMNEYERILAITPKEILDKKYIPCNNENDAVEGIKEDGYYTMTMFLSSLSTIELFVYKFILYTKPMVIEDPNLSKEQSEKLKRKERIGSNQLVNHFVYSLKHQGAKGRGSGTELVLYREGYEQDACKIMDKRIRSNYLTKDQWMAEAEATVDANKMKANKKQDTVSSLTASEEALVVVTTTTAKEEQQEQENELETQFIRTRKQSPIVNLELELNKLALLKAQQASQTIQFHTQATTSLSSHLQTIEDVSLLSEAVAIGTKSASDFILDHIQEQVIERFRERNEPGYHQKVFEQEQEEQQAEEEAKAANVLANNTHNDNANDSEEHAILGEDWKFVIEIGVKANFREGKVRWHGHVSVKIYEDACWIGDIGMGKRYKFLVYEPNVAQSFEGMIRSFKHLREVLGINGQDLLVPKKAIEMIMFICRYRMEVVVNKKTWDGVDVEPGSPPYRIEFQSDRMYTQDKITPINANEETDDAVNENKLFEISNARGKKIIRMVRRVSDILMQLTVFELPPAVAVGALCMNPIPGISFRLGNDGTVIDCLAEQADANNSGFLEERSELHTVERHLPPAFRIVGYDPKSKRKVTLGVEPQAVVEVSGGIFSPYLQVEKRRELARIVCESLILYFPNSRPFELFVPWSGSQIGSSSNNNEVTDVSKLTSIPNADNAVKRKGKIYRSVVRISKYELIVSMFAVLANQSADATLQQIPGKEDILVNFYSPAVTYAVDITLTEEQQKDRIDATILSFPEGSVRTAAIRRLCRFFKAEIIEDLVDPTIKTLHIVVLPPNKGYLTDYLEMGLKAPGEDIRPVGLPFLFFPLDTCGRALHRRGMQLHNHLKNAYPTKKEFLITVYTKSQNENPERGFVIKLYDRSTSQTSILHLGASELMRICEVFDEPDLLRDLVTMQEEETSLVNDMMESDFKLFTPKGILESKCNTLTDLLVDLVLRDLAFLTDAQGAVIPCLKSSPKGTVPT